MLAPGSGALPERVVARVNAADTPAIEAPGERLLTAPTLDIRFPA